MFHRVRNIRNKDIEVASKQSSWPKDYYVPTFGDYSSYCLKFYKQIVLT